MSSTLRVNELQHINGNSGITIDTTGIMSHGTPTGFHARITGTSSHDYRTWGEILGSGGNKGSWTASAIAGGWNSGMLNTTTGCFTFPVNGYYFCSLFARIDSFGSSTYHYIDLTKTTGGAVVSNSGANRYTRQLESQTASDYTALSAACTIYGEAGQEVGWVYVADSDSTVVPDGDTYISCFKVG